MIEEKTIQASESYLPYTGTVTIQLRNKDKVYCTKEYKNNGRWPLTYFMSLCLAGEYSSAEALRPKYLQLFYISGSKPTKTTDPNTIFTNGNRRTATAIPYMTTPQVVYSMGNSENYNGSAFVTFKFTVPFTQLVGLTSTTGVNTLALYGDENYDSNPESGTSKLGCPSAYLYVANGNTMSDIFEQGEAAYLKEDFNLYVEWKMQIKTNQ